jgi:hypothetical protein
VEFDIGRRHAKQNEHARKRHKKDEAKQVRGHSRLTVEIVAERDQQPRDKEESVGLDEPRL